MAMCDREKGTVVLCFQKRAMAGGRRAREARSPRAQPTMSSEGVRRKWVEKSWKESRDDFLGPLSPSGPCSEASGPHESEQEVTGIQD